MVMRIYLRSNGRRSLHNFPGLVLRKRSYLHFLKDSNIKQEPPTVPSMLISVRTWYRISIERIFVRLFYILRGKNSFVGLSIIFQHCNFGFSLLLFNTYWICALPAWADAFGKCHLQIMSHDKKSKASVQLASIISQAQLWTSHPLAWNSVLRTPSFHAPEYVLARRQ